MSFTNDTTEPIWVEKEFALKYKELEKDKTKNEERVKIFNEYMEKLSEKIRSEFKADLNVIEEDAAIFTGLMLKTRQAFEKAKDEHLTASYDLWEKYDSEIPNISVKISKITDTLKPLTAELKTANDLMQKLNTYDIQRVIDCIQTLTSLYGTNKEMVEFLIANFGKDK